MSEKKNKERNKRKKRNSHIRCYRGRISCRSRSARALGVWIDAVSSWYRRLPLHLLHMGSPSLVAAATRRVDDHGVNDGDLNVPVLLLLSQGISDGCGERYSRWAPSRRRHRHVMLIGHTPETGQTILHSTLGHGDHGLKAETISPNAKARNPHCKNMLEKGISYACELVKQEKNK